MTKDYSKINLDDLDEMKIATEEIAGSVTVILAHSSVRDVRRIQSARTAGQAGPAFKRLASSYYSSLANKWLDDNGTGALPAEFDEWVDMAGAAKAHVMKLAGIKVSIRNGFFTTDTFL